MIKRGLVAVVLLAIWATCVLHWGCCDPCAPCPPEEVCEVALSGYVRATGDGALLEWSKSPDSGTWWEKIADGGINGGTPVDSTFIYTKGTVNGKISEHDLADSPADAGTITAIRTYVRAIYFPGTGSSWGIHVDYYHTGGTQFIGRVSVNFNDNAGPATWYNHAMGELSGLSLTKEQADGISFKIISNFGVGAWKNDNIFISEHEARYVYTPAYSPDVADWFEVWEEPMEVYMDRLATEIGNDATMAAYSPEVVQVAEAEPLDANRVAALINGAGFVIHNPLVSEDADIGGEGRTDVVLEVTISAVVRKGARLDPSTKKEIPLVGDDTAAAPGVLEMQADLEALLHNEGALNLLESGGQPYLWYLDLGPTEGVVRPAGRKGHVMVMSRKVIGHKWKMHWS